MGQDLRWQLQDAKARFSELVKRANTEGPQHVSVRGQPSVVVVSATMYESMIEPRKSLVDHILDGPLWQDDVADAINARQGDSGREFSF
jgi:prevent-host-death family protein